MGVGRRGLPSPFQTHHHRKSKTFVRDRLPIRTGSQFGQASNSDRLPIRRVFVVVSVAALRAAGQNKGGSKL